MKSFLICLVFMVGCGQSAAKRDLLFPLEVDTSQTQLVNDRCETVFTVLNISSGQEYSLIWLQVSLIDQDGRDFVKVYDFEDLTLLLDQPQLPPVSAKQVALDVDLSRAGLVSPPFEGSLQMIGVGYHQTVAFSGGLICQ